MVTDERIDDCGFASSCTTGQKHILSSQHRIKCNLLFVIQLHCFNPFRFQVTAMRESSYN